MQFISLLIASLNLPFVSILKFETVLEKRASAHAHLIARKVSYLSHVLSVSSCSFSVSVVRTTNPSFPSQRAEVARLEQELERVLSKEEATLIGPLVGDAGVEEAAQAVVVYSMEPEKESHPRLLSSPFGGSKSSSLPTIVEEDDTPSAQVPKATVKPHIQRKSTRKRGVKKAIERKPIPLSEEEKDEAQSDTHNEEYVPERKPPKKKTKASARKNTKTISSMKGSVEKTNVSGGPRAPVSSRSVAIRQVSRVGLEFSCSM